MRCNRPLQGYVDFFDAKAAAAAMSRNQNWQGWGPRPGLVLSYAQSPAPQEAALAAQPVKHGRQYPGACVPCLRQTHESGDSQVQLESCIPWVDLSE
jgi:hypothetical protein